MGHLYRMSFIKYLLSQMPKQAAKFSCSSHVLLTKKVDMCIDVDKLSIIQIRNYAAKKGGGKAPKGGKLKTMQLSKEEMSEVINIDGYITELDEVKEKLKKDFIQNLSLRSTASNIHNLIVKIEEEEYPLHELAQISKKNPNLVAINMADFPEGLKPAIQAIVESESGMNPQQDGTMIYVTIPKLTREHRENLAKGAKALFVKAKDELRTIQNYYVKEAKNKKDVSEDMIFSSTNQIMSMAEQESKELEAILKTKQKELLNES